MLSKLVILIELIPIIVNTSNIMSARIKTMPLSFPTVFFLLIRPPIPKES
jgi:hypothetical protein